MGLKAGVIARTLPRVGIRPPRSAVRGGVHGGLVGAAEFVLADLLVGVSLRDLDRLPGIFGSQPPPHAPTTGAAEQPQLAGAQPVAQGLRNLPPLADAQLTAERLKHRLRVFTR